MKKFFTTLLAAIIVGFAVFAIAYWLFNMKFSDSVIPALRSASVGLVVALLQPFFERKAKEEEDSIS
ncbi:MAG: hypothetical protein ABR502_06215, partial [Chitinophagaceae bacterium]